MLWATAFPLSILYVLILKGPPQSTAYLIRWIRTWVLCIQKRPLFQLRHNHCPLLFVLLSAERGLFLKFFIPFLNTKTNIVNNMNINGKSLGAVLEIRTEVAGW